MRFLSLLPLGVALLTCGCQTGANHQAAGGLALELDHGKKWVMPPAMKARMTDIQTAVRALAAAPQPDHAALAEKIQHELGELAANCTMTGQAHDELHRWLMPFLGLSAEYVAAKDPAVQAEKYREIQRSLEVFNRYFK